MNLIKRLVGINLIIMLAYSILIRLLNGHGGQGSSLGILIFSAFAVGIHVFICLVIGLACYAGKNKEQGQAWLMSSGLVLLIGFSTCLGNAALSS